MHKKLSLLFTCIRFSCTPILTVYKLKDRSNRCFVAQANQVLLHYIFILYNIALGSEVITFSK